MNSESNPIDDQTDSPQETVNESDRMADPQAEGDFSVAKPSGKQLIILMDAIQSNPKDHFDGPTAESIFNTWSLAWHPAVLCRLGQLPKQQGPVFDPQSPQADSAYLIPGRLLDQVPTSFLGQAEDCQSPVVVGSDDRESSLAELLRRLRGNDFPDSFESQPELVDDFQALGVARLWLNSTTIALGHVDVINHDELTSETLSAAECWKEGDFSGSKNHLRAGFEVLLRARERFYPVDSYLLDLVLTHVSNSPADLGVLLEETTPKTLVGAADVLEMLAIKAPEVLEKVRRGVDAGWLDLAGGPASEQPEHLLPLETVRTIYRKGDSYYRRHMNDRSVETLFHRNFALYPALPHLARRLGFRFGFPQAYDGGKFPLRRESKMLWASPDGTTLEALTRVPLQADDPMLCLTFPWVLGQSMRDDHVALGVWLRWPGASPQWFKSLARIQAYSPIFGRLLTAGDFFAQTDRPFDTMTPEMDSYTDPSLENALSEDAQNPVTAQISQHQIRPVFDTLSWFYALSKSLDVESADEQIQSLLDWEPHTTEELDQAQKLTQELAKQVASQIMTNAPEGTPGSLVFNPAGVARRVPLVLDQAAPDLRLCSSVASAQFLAEGTLVVADLPANGFAWVPHFANIDDSLTPMGQLKYDFEQNQIIHPNFVVSIDDKTGGFKGLKRPGDPQARMGQQLALTGISGSSDSVCMIQEGSPDISYGGPAKMEVRTRGRIVDPADESRTVARFEQTFEAYLGRPTIDLTVNLSDIDESFFSATHAAYASWGRALVCRWAWRDSDARIRRLSHLQAHPSTSDKPITPEAIEIAQGAKRITILPRGLPYHRRHGQRMLDTVLLTGRESCRSFKISLVLDLEFPHQAVQDSASPVIVVPVRSGPPQTGHRGWFYHLDHRNVAMTKIEFQPSGSEGRGASIVFHVQETAGRAARVRLRLMIPPTFAKQVDDRGQTILDLSVSGDAVDIDMTPYEIARIEVGI